MKNQRALVLWMMTKVSHGQMRRSYEEQMAMNDELVVEAKKLVAMGWDYM